MTVEVSGSEQAVRQIGVRDELDYQKAQRSRELLRDLENSVINGICAGADPQGSSTVRRTMRGIIPSIATHVFTPGCQRISKRRQPHRRATQHGASPYLGKRQFAGGSAGDGRRAERALNNFIGSNRRFSATDDVFKNQVNIYESDYGICRVIVSRFVPTGSVLLLDSSRIHVMPLAGRSFQFQPLAKVGDRESGQLIGEYTLELRNQNAHGLITGLTG